MAVSLSVADCQAQLLAQLGGQGLLDQHFEQILDLQDESSPTFVADLIALFLDKSESNLIKLAAVLTVPHPDYGKAAHILYELQGSAATFGASAIAHICTQASVLNTLRALSVSSFTATCTACAPELIILCSIRASRGGQLR